MTVTLYALKDTEGNIRYVGKTARSLGDRLQEHLRDKHKNHRVNWIQSLVANGAKPVIELVEVCDDTNWIEREQFWIAHYKNNGCRLTNGTAGGDGVVGLQHTPETRSRISNAMKGKVRSELHRKNNGKAVKRRVAQNTLAGQLVQVWDGAIDAHIAGVANHTKISECTNGKNRSSKGFMWRFVDGEVLQQIEPVAPKKQTTRPVIQCELDGTPIREWESASLASRELKIHRSAINKCLAKQCDSAGKFSWCYVDSKNTHSV